MSGTNGFRWWPWVVIAGLLIGALAGGVGGYVLANRGYTSFAEILVTGQASDVDGAFASNQYVSRQMTTYAQIASSEKVARPAAKALGSDAAALSQRITAEVAGDTTVLKLSVSGATPESAQRDAKAVTTAFIEAVTLVETPQGQANAKSRVSLRTITEPVLPLARSLPPLIVLILAGAVGGLVFAVVGTLVFRWLYPRMTALRNQGRQQPESGYERYDDYQDYYYGEPIREPIREPSPENTYKMSRPASRPAMPSIAPPPPPPMQQAPPPLRPQVRPPGPPASPPTVKSRPVSPPANPPTEKVRPATPAVGPAVKPPVVGAKPFPPPPPNGKRPANGAANRPGPPGNGRPGQPGQPAEGRAQSGGTPPPPPPGRPQGNPPPPRNGAPPADPGRRS